MLFLVFYVIIYAINFEKKTKEQNIINEHLKNKLIKLEQENKQTNIKLLTANKAINDSKREIERIFQISEGSLKNTQNVSSFFKDTALQLKKMNQQLKAQIKKVQSLKLIAQTAENDAITLREQTEELDANYLELDRQYNAAKIKIIQLLSLVKAKNTTIESLQKSLFETTEVRHQISLKDF